ncbi:hypothetical protein [Neptunomonas marina]|uniref:Uncharacterized protein n=1 Tax=Neptunomonas marina TaxID=1815562 RepID=A0A437QAI6_9GAMM|nr:hypothetical protein [Neptunomonas marina]RVU31572.1 hypothetical protein EOE65_06225 [Neptunomonas marina]
MFPYLVCEFAKETLGNLVKECFGSNFPDIVKKDQVNYIFNYLGDLDAESILLEADYVDKDYLEDYSNYYVKCFNGYGPRCARLHFFDKKIDHSVIDKVIDSNCEDKVRLLQESYLGFIVVKPLPKTFIGKTCLKQYPAFKEEENIRCILSKPYEVNLFGVRLSIDSVAFQEQDRVLSACATTAIWSSLHALSWSNVRDIPSCGDITANAINHVAGSSNRFPNNGLTNKQILRALDVEGLRHHRVDVHNLSIDVFMRSIRYHLDSGLPIILGAEIYSIGDELKHIGGHAVSVLGYNRSENRRSLYIHDDRVGPFARAAIQPLSDFGEIKDHKGRDWCLVLQRKDDEGNWVEPHQIIMPESIIVPSHKKNRIPEFYIRNTCDCILSTFDAFKKALENKGKSASQEFDYSIKIEQISDIKERVMQRSVVNKRQVLLSSLARFQWVASFTADGKAAFDILFDATDIPQGDAVSAFIKYDDKAFSFIRSILLRHKDHSELENSFNGKNFCNSLLLSLAPASEDYNAFLDEMYGELRAPKYINKEEAQLYNSEEFDVKKYYGSTQSSLENAFDISVGDKLIWAISHEGALLIGQEVEGELGHPSITGMKPARISGELCKESAGWVINAKSGRYSSNYQNANTLLENALVRFQEIFPKSSECIKHKPYHPKPH